MKRILTIIKQDWTNVLRDNLLFYIFLAPVIMAVAVRLLAPSIETVSVRVAVNEAMPQAIQENLTEFAKVFVVPDRNSIITRVEKNDDVPGIYWEDGQYEIILQGNEQEGEELSQILLSAATSPEETADFTVITHPKESLFTEYALILVLITAVMLGAIVESFNMVRDKESGMIRAWAVSPLRMAEWTIARAIFAMLAGLVMTVTAIIIIAGVSVPWGQILIGYLSSVGIAVLIGFLLGGLSNTQLQMMATTKFIMGLYSVLPILSIFVPDSWRLLFYPFPNYWMFVIFQNIFVRPRSAPVGFLAACGLTLAVTMVYLAILTPILRKKLRLK
ncbi:ABC transporter permease [Chloroflexota bacterium]|nr:ABC transporter permease [Chloroflexota bacterium]